ncbi:MAG: hypothetical protein K2I16_09860 [Muribaculaceae bacterium]|nr:hypothetical protein [Muribaculaceae bacterium]
MSDTNIPHIKTDYIISMALMLVGGAGSIVGLCVCIDWLIGLGIAIVCISSVLAYNSLSGKDDSRVWDKGNAH